LSLKRDKTVKEKALIPDLMGTAQKTVTKTRAQKLLYLKDGLHGEDVLNFELRRRKKKMHRAKSGGSEKTKI